MLANLLFIMVMASGGVYLAAMYNRRFEETLPISVMGMVMLLFLFGVAGYLAAGLIVILVASVILYILTGWCLLRGKEIRRFLKNMITPGSVFFMFLCVALSVWNYGMLASSYDEFSHWMDIVKITSAIDDFGTNPVSNAGFPDYPPAMMLFQYALQKIYFWVKPGAVFSEWRVFYCYQVFVIVILLPFFRNADFRQPLRCLLYALITLIAPLIFYTFYNSVYIDLFVGILFGAGMAMIFLWPLDELFGTIALSLTCAILTLSKDVGLLLAGSISLTYCVVHFACCKSVEKKGKTFLATAPLLATVLSQALWNWEINSAGASESFSNKIQLSTLLDIILGRDTTYRTQVLHNYWDALNLSGTGSIMGTLSGIKYVGLLFIFLVLLYCIHLLCKRVAFVDSKRMNVILGFSAVTLVGYVAGLCVMYMFKFSEYEALTLASMNRYINIVFVGVWILILLLFSQLSTLMKSSFDVEICLILIIMLFSPVQYFGRFVRGDYISDAQWYREPYEDLRQQIQENCDRDDRIYLVTVEKVVGLNFHICKFNSRPNVISGYWRIGTSSDIWTEEMTAESRKKLVDNYDYVALYEINDYFLEHFDELFTAQGDITANTLYRVNRECGVLEKCDSK